MKKSLVVMLCAVILLVSVIGCGGNSSTPVTPGSVAADIQRLACKPTAEEQASASMVEGFIASGAVVATHFFGGQAVTQQDVLNVMNQIITGACPIATELQNALAWFDQVTSGTKAFKKGAAPMPDTKPLYVLLGRIKR